MSGTPNYYGVDAGTDVAYVPPPQSSSMPAIAGTMAGAPPSGGVMLPAGIQGNANVLTANKPLAKGPNPGPSQPTQPAGDDLEAQIEAAGRRAADDQAPTLDQPKYQPPKSTGQIIAGALAALFPGAPISKIASGYIQGSDKKAQDAYARAQQEAQAKYQAAQDKNAYDEKRYDDLAKIKAQQDAEADRAAAIAEKKARDAELAQEAKARLNEQRVRDEAQAARLREQAKNDAAKIALGYQNLLARVGIADKRLQNQITVAQMANATRLATGQMRQDTAYMETGVHAQIAVLQQLGTDRRFAQTQQYRNAAMSATQIRAQENHQLAGVAAQLKAGAIDPETAQQQTDAIVQQAQSSFDKAVTPLTSLHPELGAAFDRTKQSIQEMIGEGAEQQLGGGNSDNAPGGNGQPTINLNIGGGQRDQAGSLYHQELDTVQGGGQGGGRQTTGNGPTIQVPALGSYQLLNGAAQAPPPSLVSDYAQMWEKHGGDKQLALQMGIVGANESNGNPHAVSPPNENGTYDLGLWQINSAHVGQMGPDGKPIDGRRLVDDPEYNTQVAVMLAKNAQMQGQGATQPWASSQYQGAYGGWNGITTPPPKQPVTHIAQATPPLQNSAKQHAEPQKAPAQPPATMTPMQAIEQGLAAVRANPKAYDFNTSEEQLKQQESSGAITKDEANAAYSELAQIYGRKAGPLFPPVNPRANMLQAAHAQNPNGGVDLARLFTIGDGSANTRNYRQPAPPYKNVIGDALSSMERQGIQNTLSTPASANIGPQQQPQQKQSPYLADLIARFKAMTPHQRAAFLAKQPPRIQAALRGAEQS